MQLSHHLDKGIWTLADKVLTAFYGLFLLLVVRILPEEAFGNFILIQQTYLIIAHLAASLGMAPYIKYLHETDDRLALQSIALALMTGFITVAVLILWFFREPLGSIFNSAEFAGLYFFVPLLFFTSMGKLITNELFRANHQIREIFFTDAIYFTGNVLMISWLIFHQQLQRAGDVLAPMTVSFFLASLLSFWLVRKQIILGFRFSTALFGRMLQFGKYVFGSAATSIVYERSDIYIVSAILNPEAVALLGAAKIFLRVFDIYRQAMALLAFPAFARLHAERRLADLRSLYEKGIFISNALLLPTMVALVIAADFLFDVILAGRYPDGATVLRWYTLMGFLVSWWAIGEGVLFGIGIASVPFYSRVFVALLNFVLNVVLVTRFQVIGAVFASLISFFVLAAFSTYFVKKEIGFTFTGIFRRYRDMTAWVRSRAFRRKDE